MRLPVTGVAPAGEPRAERATGMKLKKIHATSTSGNSQGSDAARRRTYLKPRKGWQAVRFGELWRSRELLREFTLRDITVRYKQTFFGVAWALVQPIVQVLVFSVFFGNFLGVGDRVNEAAGRPVPYPLFAMTGQIIWNFFALGVTGASNSLIVNAGIIRKIYVPRLVMPMSALGKPALDSLVVFVLMIGLVGWYAADPNYEIWFTPKLALSFLILMAAAVPALGVGLILAAVSVNYRDLRHALPFLIQTGFYVTPVIYPVRILRGPLERLIYLNPIAGFVQAHRGLAMDLVVDWWGLAISGAVSVLLLVFGLFYFARVERHFADTA
jgi:lipopolysaccharide transport system permease protein